MVAGLAFLSKKSFNPKNLSNQKTVWEAREQKKAEEKRLQERQTQLKREQEDEDLARVRHGDTGGEKASLSFMYATPPGLGDGDGTKQTEEEPATTNDLLQRQPGDDDAAAAFRAMLAGAAAVQEEQEQNHQESLAFSNSRGAALQGTAIDRTFSEHDGRSALEKAVGRKDGNGAALTLEQQVARFPQLQNAPMAKGMKGTDVQVKFNPLGTQLRNVQCMACGVWGHTRGDRECTKSGWDPFSSKGPVYVAAAAAVNTLAMQPSEKKQEKEAVAAVNKGRRHDSSDSSDSDDSYERRRRKERKKRRKEKKRRRRRSPSKDEKDRTSSYDDRRSDHKMDKKKRRRYDSDSD